MHSTHILATMTALIATAVFALPGPVTARAYPLERDNYLRSVEESQNQCGKDQTIACCNNKNLGDTDRDSLLGSPGLHPLLGGNFQAITVPVLAIPTTPQQACGSNVAACCQKNDQTGAINIDVQCSPVDVL